MRKTLSRAALVTFVTSSALLSGCALLQLPTNEIAAPQSKQQLFRTPDTTPEQVLRAATQAAVEALFSDVEASAGPLL